MRFADLKLRNKILLLNVLAMLPVLAVLLGYVLPQFHARLVQDRVDGLQSSAEIASGILQQFEARMKRGELNEADAKTQAIAAIGALRYGKEGYFWINDENLKMIAHPIKPEMNGQDLQPFRDPNGKAFFSELTKKCKDDGSGYVDYLWPKPGEKNPVPKISFGKIFRPWGWIVGTGIYVDDIDAINRGLQLKLLFWVGLIFLVSAVLSFIFANQIAATLSSAIHQVQETGNHFQRLSESLADQGNSLSASVSQTAASLQETSATVEEVQVTTENSKNNAAKSRQLAQDSKERSLEGEQTVQQMIASMKTIRDSNEAIVGQIEASNTRIADILKVIQEIGNKTKVINDIVFQTKLLSFNASVEAARAGEHGKGFAVVAEEVGNLAQMSGNAAKEISAILDASAEQVRAIIGDTKSQVEGLVHDGQEKVARGTEVAESCGQVLGTIRGTAESVATAVDEIAEAAREQANAIGEIKKAVLQIETATNSNQNSSHQVAEYSGDVARQVLKLQGLVGQIRRLIDGAEQSLARIEMPEPVKASAPRKAA